MSDDKPFAIPDFELDKVPANLEELENNKQQIQRRIPKWMGFWKDWLFKMYVIETASWKIDVGLPAKIKWLVGIRDKLYRLTWKIKVYIKKSIHIVKTGKIQNIKRLGYISIYWIYDFEMGIV